METSNNEPEIDNADITWQKTIRKQLLVILVIFLASACSYYINLLSTQQGVMYYITRFISSFTIIYLVTYTVSLNKKISIDRIRTNFFSFLKFIEEYYVSKTDLKNNHIIECQLKLNLIQKVKTYYIIIVFIYAAICVCSFAMVFKEMIVNRLANVSVTYLALCCYLLSIYYYYAIKDSYLLISQLKLHLVRLDGDDTTDQNSV